MLEILRAQLLRRRPLEEADRGQHVPVRLERERRPGKALTEEARRGRRGEAPVRGVALLPCVDLADAREGGE